jgi:hypothetical protein
MVKGHETWYKEQEKPEEDESSGSWMGEGALTGLIWLRIETGGGLF